MVFMKTVGERIRQAREGLAMSGEELAQKAGYKTQSGIGNLENRAGGAGGKRLGKIADALDVTTDWLLNGPDSDVVPYKSQSAPNVIPLVSQSGFQLPHVAQARANYNVNPSALGLSFKTLADACMKLPPSSRNIAASLLAEIAHRPDNYITVFTAFEAIMVETLQETA